MRFVKSFWVLPLLLAALISCATAYYPRERGTLKDDLQRVTDFYAARDHRVGLGFLYSHPGLEKVYAVSGYRDISESEALQAADLYEIGSATKMFIAAVMLQLVEEGLVSLDDTLDRFGYGFDRADEITIRNLLQHTSQIPDYFSNRALFAADEDYVKERTDGELLTLGLTAPPVSSGWHYSNTNYILLGSIIEKVSGAPAESEIRRRILEPLGMRNTFFRGKEEFTGNIAIGYYYHRGFWNAWDGINPQIYSYAGCMVSTLDDMYTFLRALFSGELISGRSLALMKDFIPANGRFTYGLGMLAMQSMNRRFIGHGGTSLGTINYAFFCEETGEYFIYFTTLMNDNLRGFEKSVVYVLKKYGY